MLIDEYLPEYHIAKRHETIIQAPAEAIYPLARQLDMSSSLLIRGLFALRGLPANHLNLAELLKQGFFILKEKENEELVIGLAGRFWTFAGDLQRLNPQAFREFREAGYAKAVWNFSLQPMQEDFTRLSTETRVFCTDNKSLRKFRFYWTFIGPFSGLIRKEMLQVIKQKAG